MQAEDFRGVSRDEAYGEIYVKVRQKEAELARKISQLESQTQGQAQSGRALQQRIAANVEGYYDNCALIDDRIVRIPVITEEEIKRRVEALNAAYKMFQAIIREYEGKPAAYKARAEIMIAIEHLRSIHAHNHAAAMLAQFIKDNPKDGELAQLSLRLRLDYLAWAHTAPDPKMEEMDRLAETGGRFRAAREELDKFIKDPVFRDEREALETARMALAKSFLDEARLVGALSPTQSRGRYVRAAEELLQLAREGGKTVSAGAVFSPVWQIARELESRRFWEEAIDVYRMLVRQYPVRARVNQTGLRIANAYHSGVKDYLRAVEAYQEFLSSDSGANAADVQRRILDIGRYLRGESRWVEALHVYGVFVDSFPRHPQAGEALRAIGEIHQANHAWEKAIAAYERVIGEYRNGDWTRLARMSIATCYIQLSRWRKAIRAYEDYIQDYPRDGQASIARTRIPVLQDIERFQELIDEGKSPKSDDAQNEIARIVEAKLGDRVKAIIEYEKVAKNYPNSHLADDALFAAGRLYLNEGKLEEGRDTLLRVAVEHPTSPMADDALYMLGQSYERQAQQIAGITRQEAQQLARRKVQSEAYKQAEMNIAAKEKAFNKEIEELRLQGRKREAEMAEAGMSAKMSEERYAQAGQAARQSFRIEETMTAYELANRQDRINAALRDAIKAYTKASAVTLGDYADDALLRMAEIYETELKDPKKAMEVYDRIVRTFPGTAVAENAVWRRAQYFVREGRFKKAEDEYKTFVSNYPNSKRVEEAIFRLAEVYEQQNKWVEAMDTYRNYIDRFSRGPRVQQARERIIWIKTYRLYE